MAVPSAAHLPRLALAMFLFAAVLGCLGCTPRAEWHPAPPEDAAAINPDVEMGAPSGPVAFIASGLGGCDHFAISPDGRWIAAYAAAGTARIADPACKRDVFVLDAAKREVVWTLATPDADAVLATVAFSPARPWLALILAKEGGDRVRIYDLERRSPIAAFDVRGRTAGPASAFSGDGTRLAFSGPDLDFDQFGWIAVDDPARPRYLGLQRFERGCHLGIAYPVLVPGPGGSVELLQLPNDHPWPGPLSYARYRLEPGSLTPLEPIDSDDMLMAATPDRSSAVMVGGRLVRDGVGVQLTPQAVRPMIACAGAADDDGLLVRCDARDGLQSWAFRWTPEGIRAAAIPPPSAPDAAMPAWRRRSELMDDPVFLARLRRDQPVRFGNDDDEGIRRWARVMRESPFAVELGEGRLAEGVSDFNWDDVGAWSHQVIPFGDGWLAVAFIADSATAWRLDRAGRVTAGARLSLEGQVGLPTLAAHGSWIGIGGQVGLDRVGILCFAAADLAATDADGRLPERHPRLRLDLRSPTYEALQAGAILDDWVAWTPDGRFAGTQAGIARLGWMVPGPTPRLLAAEQVSELLQRPDAIVGLWRNGAEDPAAAGAVRDALQVLVGAAVRAPTASIAIDPATATTTAASVAVSVAAEPGSDGVAEVRVFQNGARCDAAGRGLRPDAMRWTFQASLVPGENRFAVEAVSAGGVASRKVEAAIIRIAPAPEADCRVLAIGIDAYRDPALRLAWAVDDARTLAQRVADGARPLYRRVEVATCLDAAADRAGMLAALAAAAAGTRPEDTLILVYAGHGALGERADGRPGRFVMVPSDMTTLVGDDDAIARNGVASDELQRILAAAPARRQVVIIDACHAGQAASGFASRGAGEQRALWQLHRASGVAVIAATTAEQDASEAATLGHGLFTAAALEALASGAVAGQPLTIADFAACVGRRVPELAERLHRPAQYPVCLMQGQDFPLAMIPAAPAP